MVIAVNNSRIPDFNDHVPVNVNLPIDEEIVEDSAGEGGAGHELPTLPAQASPSAMDVLSQIASGQVPPKPIPSVKEAADPLAATLPSHFPVLPELPVQASDRAREVLDDLAVERPPRPNKPEENVDTQVLPAVSQGAGRRRLRGMGQYI